MPILFRKAWVSASVLDISRENTSEADMDVKGVDSPSWRERAMAIAVFPVVETI